MFGGLQLKLILGGVVFVLLSAIIGTCYWYYTSSQEKIKTLTENAVKLELAVSTQRNTIESMKNDFDLQSGLITGLTEKNQKSENEKDKLSRKLRKHDLRELSKKEPKKITKIINRATLNRFNGLTEYSKKFKAKNDQHPKKK